MSHRKPEPVEVVDYNPEWAAEYRRLEARVKDVLGDLLERVEHVGSTSVPGLAAKPVVDLYAVVDDGSRPEAIVRLEAVGYAHEGELGVPGRAGFAWPHGEPRHHLYLCGPTHNGLHELVRFRDYLRSHPTEAAAYGDLKRALAREHRDDRDAYSRGKSTFVEAILEQAAT